MKGTIDIQIKHKDGSIENRREHNVIFDIPSLTFKMWSESPLAIATGVPTNEVTLTKNWFSTFCLSEDTISITEPQYVPVSLITTTGSSSKWYYGPVTTTTTDNSITRSATWTVQSAMTLKSIFYRNVSESTLLGQWEFPRLISKDDIHIDLAKRLKKSVLNGAGFLLDGNTLWNGLVPSSTSSTAYEYAYVDYPLCNPNEGFICSYTSGSSTYYSSNILDGSTNASLEIRNKDTNAVIRSFPRTQFVGFRTTYTPPSGSTGNDYSYRCVCIVNTGSKNVLTQPAYGGKSLNIWQIPDTATEDPIPIAATVLENQCDYFSSTSNGSLYNAYMYVIGPYMSWVPNQTATGTSRMLNIARVNDDFSVTTFSGLSGSAVLSSSSYYQYSSGKMTLLRRYPNSSGGWNTGSDNNGRYSPTYTNITASNFSTPIVLAEGDVLTVSYKIEVA